MYDHRLFVRTLSEFAADLVTDYEPHHMLQRLAERTAEVLGLAGCAVFLGDEKELDVATAVPERIRQLEVVQVSAQRGPCVEAHESCAVVAVPDVRSSPEGWGEYRRIAEELGLLAVAGIPMALHGESVGALSLYADRPRDWAEDDLAAAQVMADMATGYLVNGSKLRQREQLAEQLTRALESRVVIEQAKGILAEALGIPLDEAFKRMRARSRNRNEPIRSVAEAVVQRRVRP